MKHKTIVILYSSQRSGLPGIYLHLFYIQKLRLSPFGSLWYTLVKLSKQILINIPRGLILHSSYLNLDYSAWATKKFCCLFCAGTERQGGEVPQAQQPQFWGTGLLWEPPAPKSLLGKWAPQLGNC